MKIGVLARVRFDSANGVDKAVLGQVSSLAEQGHDVSVITFEKCNSRDLEEISSKGIKVLYLEGGWINRFKGLRALSDKFDVLWMHSVFSPQNWLGFFAANKKWIISPHGGYSEGQIAYRRTFLKRLILFLIEKRMLREAALVHVLSEREKEQVLHIAPSANIVISPNGVSKNNDFVARDFEGVRKFLYVGRLDWMHKGLDVFLEALNASSLNGKWEFHVVGPGSEEQIQFLKGIVNRLGMNDWVVFYGPLYGDEKRNIMRNAHVFVHTSRWEGLPFSVIEAMSSGLPVLVSPETNMGDLVTKYDSGWLADDRGLVKAIREAVNADAGELRSKGENARRAVSEELKWDSIVKTILGGLTKNEG